MCLLWLIVRGSFFFFVCVSCGGWAASIPAPWRQEETRDCSPTPQAVRFHGGICHSPRTSTSRSSWCANSWSHSYLSKIEKNAFWGQRKLRSGERPERRKMKRETNLEWLLSFLLVFVWILTSSLRAKLGFGTAGGLWDPNMQMCARLLNKAAAQRLGAEQRKTCMNPQAAMDTNCQLQCARMLRWWCRLLWQSSQCGRPFGWRPSSCGGWMSRRKPANGRRGHPGWGSALWSPLGCEFCRTGRSPPVRLPGGYHPAQRVSFPSTLSEPASPQQPIVKTQGRRW